MRSSYQNTQKIPLQDNLSLNSYWNRQSWYIQILDVYEPCRVMANEDISAGLPSIK